MFGPEWWHHHGTKMMVNKKETNFQEKQLVITGSAANVKIFKWIDNRWMVEWEVRQSQNEGVKGRMSFNLEKLLQSFGLQEGKIEFGDQWLLRQYQATCAAQRFFIRYEDYLNIPCPGTGHDGDPNVSILLNDEIKEAVCKLIE